jgi:hypothetical protein
VYKDQTGRVWQAARTQKLDTGKLSKGNPETPIELSSNRVGQNATRGVTMAPRPLWEVPLVVIVIFGCGN